MRYIKHLGSSYPPNRLSRAKTLCCTVPQPRTVDALELSRDTGAHRRRLAPSSPQHSGNSRVLQTGDRADLPALRRTLAPITHASRKDTQGPDYNDTLARFVVQRWDIGAAKLACRSLGRLFVALQQLEAHFQRR